MTFTRLASRFTLAVTLIFTALNGAAQSPGASSPEGSVDQPAAGLPLKLSPRLESEATPSSGLRDPGAAAERALAHPQNEAAAVERNQNLALAALSLVLLLFVGWYVVSRRRRVGAADEALRDLQTPAATSDPEFEPEPEPEPAPVLAALFLDPVPWSDTEPGLPTGPATASDDGPRMFSVHQTSEIQQQAQSLVAGGHVDQAIGVLRNHIDLGADAGTDAGVWLDLLQVYGRSGRREDYESLREQFESTFGAPLPGYHAAAIDSNGLEDFPRTLARIVGLWPSPKVLDLIEELVLSRNTIADGKPLDLSAYRDLVMLHGVRKDVIGVGRKPR